MASYCEVCQGLYPSPHPHPPPPQWRAARRSVSWPRVSSGRRRDRSSASPMRFSYDELTGGDVDGAGDGLGGGAYPGASPPLPPRHPPHRSPHPQCSASGPTAATRDGAGPPYTASSPPPSLAGAFQERYRDATYCSLRRADGVMARPDYLHRGEGRGCVDACAYGADGEGGAWTGFDDFALAEEGPVPFTSSSWAAAPAMGKGRAQPAPSAEAAAHEEGQHAREHQQRTPNRASPGLATASVSLSATQRSGSRHHARRRTPEYRGAAPAAVGLSYADPLAAPPTAGAPVPAHATRAAAAAVHPPRPQTEARPMPLTPPQAARARESLAELVAKIRAEVSKEQDGAAATMVAATSDARAESSSRRHRRHRAESARLPARTVATAAASDAPDDDDAAAGAYPRSSSASPETSTAARTSSAPASTQPRQHRRRGSREHRRTHTSDGSATAERALHWRSSRGRGSSSRARRTASSSSSASSTSSAVHLRRAVKAAESVLRRMQEQQHEPHDKRSGDSDGGGRLAQRGTTPESGHGAREHSSSSSSPMEAQHPQSRDTPALHRPHRKDPPSSRAPPAAPAARSPSATPTSSRSGARVSQVAPSAPRPQHTADLAASQETWRATQEHRVERLREGLAALCSAVRKDLQKVRDDVARIRAEAREEAAAAAVGSRAEEALASATALQSAVKAATAACRAEASAAAASAVTPTNVVSAVAQCTPAEQRRIAALLLPHLRPLMEVIQEEVRHQLRERRREQQAEQQTMEQRLHAYVAEAVTTAAQRRALVQEDSHADESGRFHSSAASSGPPWAAAFSSPDALDAHLRATARAVLHEEDERRYGLTNENERRHERRVQRLQEEWQASLRAAEVRWHAEMAATLERESSAWTRRVRAPLQQHADVLQDIVTALTRDVTHLQEQQDTLSAEVTAKLEQEREMRLQEQARLAERLEQRVRQLLPSEVDAACIRFHVQREQRMAPGAATRHATTGASATAAPLHSTSAEELRLAVVQPAMDHMRRLLVSHQEMLNASVEDRCQRAEHAVDGSRHVWTQNIAELRSKLSALRGDVRGAFAELCENLNVAAPAL